MSAVSTNLTGTLGLELVCVGSKSERQAYVLYTGKDTVILRLMAENTFIDVNNSPLKPLIGRTVTVTGVKRGYIFVASSYREEK